MSSAKSGTPVTVPCALVSETISAPVEIEAPSPVDTDGGDHERFAHYVQKDKILESALTGKPVIALCGKVWVPGRDPEKFPVCPDCKKIYDKLK